MANRTLKGLAAAIFLFSYPAASAADSANTEEENTYLIGFNDERHVDLIEEVGGELGDTWERIDAAEAELSQAEAAWMSSQSEVEYVEMDRKVEVNDSHWENWGLEKVNAPNAWDLDVTGENIEVAVVDTGISTSHPSLDVANGFSSVSYTDSYNDDNGHGSHAAGIIAANDPEHGLMGVAPNAELFAVKVLDQDGNGSLTQVLTGIDWAIEQGVDVITMSFGTLTDSITMQEMLDDAYDRGIVTVAASGNRGESSNTSDRVEYPARYPSVIAVGAVDQNNNRASFSAAGEAVEFAAPGVNIVSTYKDSEYGALSGTSMATPFVAGAFALMKEAYPDAEAPVLRGMLQESALDLGSEGRDTEYGYGLLQIPDLTQATAVQEDSTSPEEEPQSEEPAEDPVEEDPVEEPGDNVNEEPTDDNQEEPVERDIEENPLDEDPIEPPEDTIDVQIPFGVDAQVVYTEEGTADVYVFWDRPETEEISHHRVYKNGEYYEEVQQGKLFKDENVEPGTYTYHVTAVGSNDRESEKSKPVEVEVVAEGFTEEEETEAPGDEETAETDEFTWPRPLDNPPSFKDVNDDYWAAGPINELSSRGIIQGSNGQFRPGESVRRGQALAMIGRLLEWNSEPTDTRFPDVDESYFGSGFIAHATNAGYISGFSDGTFRPNNDITRGQMAAILGDVFDFSSEPGNRFTDVGERTTGQSAIAYLAENNIVSGYDDGTFRPGEDLSRAQFASIFYKLGEHLQEK